MSNKIELSEERKGEIALKIVQHRMEIKGVRISVDRKREIQNEAKKYGIPQEDYKIFLFKVLIRIIYSIFHSFGAERSFASSLILIGIENEKMPRELVFTEKDRETALVILQYIFRNEETILNSGKLRELIEISEAIKVPYKEVHALLEEIITSAVHDMFSEGVETPVS